MLAVPDEEAKFILWRIHLKNVKNWSVRTHGDTGKSKSSIQIKDSLPSADLIAHVLNGWTTSHPIIPPNPPVRKLTDWRRTRYESSFRYHRRFKNPYRRKRRLRRSRKYVLLLIAQSCGRTKAQTSISARSKRTAPTARRRRTRLTAWRNARCSPIVVMEFLCPFFFLCRA